MPTRLVTFSHAGTARAGALLGQKTVRAVDDALGVLNTLGVVGCEPDLDGFYRGGCVPVTKPGGDEIWRMGFTNTGNLPQDRVYAVDLLPVPGDTGAITSTARGSGTRRSPPKGIGRAIFAASAIRSTR